MALPRSVVGAEIVPGPVELQIDEPELDLAMGTRGGRIVADRRRALVHLHGVATLGIEDGRRVAVDPVDGVGDDVLEDWLAGFVAALLLAQSGRFALHANLVEVGGAAIAVAGVRGAGKTTTSMRVAQRGGRILGDDVLPLAVDAGTVTYSTTGHPLRIDAETMAVLGWDAAGARRLAPSADKLPLARPAAPPGPLHGVVVLAEEPVATVERHRLAGARAVEAVLAHGYRIRLLRRIWGAELLAWGAAVVGAVPVHLVRRPPGRWTGDEVAAAVEATASERACTLIG